MTKVTIIQVGKRRLLRLAGGRFAIQNRLMNYIKISFYVNGPLKIMSLSSELERPRTLSLSQYDACEISKVS